MYDGSDSGQDDERQLQADGSGKAVPIGLVVGRQVPDAGRDEHGERSPRDPAELAGGHAWHVGAGAAQHRYERAKGELSTDPHGRRKDVQEQSERLDINRQHVATLATFGTRTVFRTKGAGMLLWPLNGAFLVINLAIALVKLFALIDAATRPAAAYVYAEKQTKQLWLIILAVALVTTFLDFLSIIGLVAALVYLLDVRPAIVKS